MDNINEVLNAMNGGCSSMSWTTEDNKHLWGRNFDFNCIAEESKIIYIPKGKSYYGCGTRVENNIVEKTKTVSKYAAVGTGIRLMQSTPILYEGVNEKGVMGGQLAYRCFAKYNDKKAKGTIAVQPPFLVTYLLTRCKSVDEVVDMVENKITLMNIPILGQVPPIHWIFSDKTGESVIIEPDESGVSIYRNSMGVMTNSPSYSWHCLNLLNYFNIRNLDYDTLEINGEKFNKCFTGDGTMGLPGDCSSTSRFIRLSFLKKYAVKGIDEEEGVSNIIHLFNNVAVPLGLVELSEKNNTIVYDECLERYEYTIYTAVMCAESLKFYWVTYENQRVQCIDLNDLLDVDDYVEYDLNRMPDFKYITKK
ncbi:linear amide C-N hydrolase [uncultured Clostridium sp.]|uniref:linear amide C-N hydrolase n=1 Tax=uncultured Clostridium sp. TaxID=59620 RepID=UPI000822506B|nr:linear amide C-N hydrolase [uncultured Clostridium sp.]SCJ51963.1 Penicillin acylase precursor [uncultured Clostridium sp.]